MAAALPAGGILAAVTIIIALCLCGTTTVTCDFPMIMSLERGIRPLNSLTKLSELKTLDHARHRISLQNYSNDSGFLSRAPMILSKSGKFFYFKNLLVFLTLDFSLIFSSYIYACL